MRLLELYNELLSELEPRKVVGRGSQHHILSTRQGNKMVFKVKNPTGWYGLDLAALKLFLKYPQIFPIVYRMGNGYAVLENLDSKKAENEIIQMQRKVQDYIRDNDSALRKEYDDYDDIIDRAYLNILWIMYKSIIEQDLYLAFLKNLIHNKILDNSILAKYYNLLEKFSEIMGEEYLSDWDLHEGQFGYTDDGRLKILDF